MSQSFTLRVPAAEPFASLSAEVAARFIDISGGAVADAEQWATAVRDAVRDLTHGDHHGDIELVFHHASNGFEVTVRYQDRTTVVKQTPRTAHS